MFSTSQLSQLKKEFGQIKTMNPDSPQYKRLIAMMNGWDHQTLVQVSKAEINFLSSLALNRTRNKQALTMINTASLEMAAGKVWIYVGANTGQVIDGKALNKAAKSYGFKFGISSDPDTGAPDTTAYEAFGDKLSDADFAKLYKALKAVPKVDFLHILYKNKWFTGKGWERAREFDGLEKASLDPLHALMGNVVEEASARIAFIPATAELVVAFKNACKNAGLAVRVKMISSGSSRGYIVVGLKSPTPTNHHLLFTVAKTMGMATGGTVPQAITEAYIGSSTTMAFTENSLKAKPMMSMASVEDDEGVEYETVDDLAAVAPSAVILASTVEKARNGSAVTTYELAPLITRLSHADISIDEIADRFTKAFGDVLMPKE